MDEVIWEDPPRKTWEHQRIARQLRERPKQWALVGLCHSSGMASTMATKIRRGMLPAYTPEGHFEAMARKVHGDCRVYARYVGGKP